MPSRRRHPLPGAGAGLFVGLLTVVAVLCWRFAAVGVAAPVAALALLAAWIAGPRLAGDRRWLEHALALPLLVSALLLIARHQPGWWPCDLACGGGRGYETIGPVPAVAFAFAACLALQIALGGCHLWCRPREADGDRPLPTPALIQAAAWVLIGASLFYLMTALRLGLVCRQCLAYHTAALALVGPLRGGYLRAPARFAALLVGFLALLIAYGPALRVDVADPGTVVALDPTSEEARWAERADAGRRLGRDDAASTLELGIDFQCPHCAEQWGALMRALAPTLADGRARVIVRHVARASEPASPDLARWAFAAAAEGRHRAYVAAMLGSRGGVSAADLARGPNAQAIGLDALIALAAAHQAGIATLVEGDKTRLKQLRFSGKTPFAVLLARDGRERGRWSGDIDVAALTSALGAASGTTGGGR